MLLNHKYVCIYKHQSKENYKISSFINDKMKKSRKEMTFSYRCLKSKLLAFLINSINYRERKTHFWWRTIINILLWCWCISISSAQRKLKIRRKKFVFFCLQEIFELIYVIILLIMYVMFKLKKYLFQFALLILLTCCYAIPPPGYVKPPETDKVKTLKSLKF